MGRKSRLPTVFVIAAFAAVVYLAATTASDGATDAGGVFAPFINLLAGLGDAVGGALDDLGKELP